ncbi:MAG: hypothetical protein M1814_006865 [Vezdaea aestivalis]|nr:MAG: hypothetical protein M1814_006865 [Vezdaea aestivalis]
MKSALVILPFLLPAFSSAVKLSDFAALPSTVTSTQCTKVYNVDISECSTSDFQNGSQCSQECIVALLLKSQSIQKSCLDAVTAEDSLLAYAFHNQLAAALCKNVYGGTGGEGSTKAPGPTSTTPTTTTQEPPQSQPPTETNAPPPDSSTSVSSTSSRTEGSARSTSAKPSSRAAKTPAISADPAPSPTSGASGFRTTAIIDGSSSLTQELARSSSVSGGGGSPFQFAGAASSLRVSAWILVWISTVGLILLLR